MGFGRAGFKPVKKERIEQIGGRGLTFAVAGGGNDARRCTKHMLDAFIIEEIKRREQSREERDRPMAELPLPPVDDRPKRRSETEEEKPPPRGVVVIDL